MIYLRIYFLGLNLDIHINVNCIRVNINIDLVVGCFGFMAYQPLWVIQRQILSIYTYIFNQRFQNEY